MILFLDDCPHRRSAAAAHLPRVLTTSRARIAIETLPDARFTVAYLDHDLGDESGDPRSEDPDGMTGLDVARWIAANRTDLRIVVHSMNQPAATRMAGVLRDAGVEVEVVPFTALLAQWRAA